MDIGDPTDPNLDGDFQALLEARQKRKNQAENEAAIKQLATSKSFSGSTKTGNESLEELTAVTFAHVQTTGALPAPVKIKADVDGLRNSLFGAVDRDDEAECRKLKEKSDKMDVKFHDAELRRVEDGSTVLHYALERERWKAARFLISFGDERLLTEGYGITVRKLSSQKSCLHILAEKGNVDLTRLLIDQVTKKPVKTELLRRTVLMEPEGQRPRPLTCMHIAALKGHTPLIELFHGLDVDVNITNNKNDTPVLWAARGNHIETVRYLIRLGADLQLENDKGSTPLYWAVRYGFADLVRVLVFEGKANIHQERKLGLVVPIVLASALGYSDIVRILLENGANANKAINNDQTALHLAAAEGNNDVISVLINNGNVDINHADSNGNTALLFAAKAGNVSTMKLLVEQGATLDCKNKTGQSVWDFAMQRPNNDFLKAVAQLYRQAKRFKETDRKLLFVVGKTPLHVAASSGDIDKMRCLLEMGADPRAVDLNGNTYFHVAARDNRADVLVAFLGDVDVDNTNHDGDTALHLAAKNGHRQSVTVLLQKAKMDARNKLGMTPLHEAVGSDAASPDLIGSMVDMIVKANNWSLVDAKDNRGNTALHIAARRGRPEILAELGSLNPKVVNLDGDSPFHIAARSGIPFNLETMITVFNKPEKGVNIDQTSEELGETCLHICARRGDVANLNHLILCGADLSLQNAAGNTIVHVVVEESVLEPSKTEALLDLYRSIAASATRWYCMKNDLQYPNEESELYYSLLRTAMVHLTSEIRNRDGRNVVAYAVIVGAVDLLEEILNTPNVYRFKETDRYVFDISNLVPQTTFGNGNRRSSLRKKSSVAPVCAGEETDKNRKRGTIKDPQTDTTCYLDLVVSLEDEVLASRILEIYPLKQLVRNYWNTYQWIYAVLMAVHIVYMSLYSVYAIPLSANLHDQYSSTTHQCQSGTTYSLYGLFLIWPGLLLLYEIYYFCYAICRLKQVPEGGNDNNDDDRPTQLATTTMMTKEEKEEEGRRKKSCCPRSKIRFGLLSLPYRVVMLIFSYLGHLTTIAFCALVIAWYAVFLCATTMATYLEVISMVLVLGWLFTISFTKGFQEIHAFSIMLRYIIIRDISRFFVVYVFVLLGCGLGFHVLLQLIPTTDPNYAFQSPWTTLFNTFNTMLGQGSVFPDQFDSSYPSYGGDPAFVEWLYIFYIIIATVILMSLLVGMMTDTYTGVQSKEGTTWKVGSLRLALQIERSMPFIKRMLRATGFVRDRIAFEEETRRWIMSIDQKDVTATTNAEADEVLKAVQRLDNKLDHLHGSFVDLSRQVESLASRLNAGGSGGPKRQTPSLLNVANQIRERPFTGKGSRRK